MPIRFDPINNTNTLAKEYPELMLNINTLIRSGDYDLRSIYTAITMLKETYREAMRTAMNDKDKFDSFIDSMDVLITSYVSRSARPLFESETK